MMLVTTVLCCRRIIDHCTCYAVVLGVVRERPSCALSEFAL